MNSLRSRIIFGTVAVVVLIGFVVWAVVRGEEPPDFREPPAPVASLPRSDEEVPFDDPIEEPTLEEDPGEPPPDEGILGDVTQRWPGVSDAMVDAAEQSFELDVSGGGRMLVLVDCASPAFGMSIVLNGVGLSPETDIIGLLSPATDRVIGFVTDPAGTGFGAVSLDLPAETYALTFDTLGNLSIAFRGCPEYFAETVPPG